jgi:hypothetical protein
MHMESKVRSNKPVPLWLHVRNIYHKYIAQNRTQVSKGKNLTLYLIRHYWFVGIICRRLYLRHYTKYVFEVSKNIVTDTGVKICTHYDQTNKQTNTTFAAGIQFYRASHTAQLPENCPGGHLHKISETCFFQEQATAKRNGVVSITH